jgi:hypothetical protein
LVSTFVRWSTQHSPPPYNKETGYFHILQNGKAASQKTILSTRRTSTKLRTTLPEAGTTKSAENANQNAKEEFPRYRIRDAR